MAKKTKKKDFNALIMNVGKAAAGGIGAELIADYIAKNSPQIIEDNPKMTEIIPIAAGSALLYFMGDEMAPIGYGMIGAGASGFADDLMSGMQGFNRVQYMNGQVADEMSAGVRFIENMQGISFGNVSEEDTEEME